MDTCVAIKTETVKVSGSLDSSGARKDLNRDTLSAHFSRSATPHA